MTADSTRPAATASGSFAPLRQPVFAVLWAATVLGNIGSFMRDLGPLLDGDRASASPAAVALIQTAATLPIFLLAIPGPGFSDILGRRRFLIGIRSCWRRQRQPAAGTHQHADRGVPGGADLVGGIGAALMGPTWQSIVPELVPRSDLKNAVALNSLGINIARALGPAARGPAAGQLRRGGSLPRTWPAMCS
ncbi:Calcium-responsive transactivator [Manis javanica]|nr:Calcium-responsive transactivator [Manis javanica]